VRYAGAVKRFLKWLAGLVLALLLVASGLVLHTWYFKPLSINWFYTRVFAQFSLEHPELLSSLRILPPALDFYSGELDDASPAHDERVAADLKYNHDVLLSYDRNALDREGKLSYDVLEYFLRIQVEGYPFRHHDFPINQTFGMQSGLPRFMAEVHEVTTARDAERYIARLRQFPRKFSQVLEGLKLREAEGIFPPQFTVEETIAQMQGFIAPAPSENMLWVSFKAKLEKTPSIDPAAREKLLAAAEAAIKDEVYPAYRLLIDSFTALKPKAQGNFGAWHLPNGDAYYAWCVKQHTTTEMTPEQIHAIGLSEVERIGGEMDAILRGRGLSEGSVADRTRQLAEDPTQRYAKTAEEEAAMLARFQAILDEVNAGLGGAFDVRPQQGVVVKAVPAFAEKNSPGAYYESGSFDGKRPGIFYANMRDPAETPKFAMRTLAYHEGIPGHHFQITIAQELKGVPFFRRVLPFTAFHEGWALYAERLTWELGFEKDPLDDLGRLRDERMRAVRLVVDTGIHAKRWSREQAISYMMNNTGMAQSEVTAEIERYFVSPGQALAYKVGMLKILELREKAKRELGPRFDLKQFHDQVLTHGALPLVLLEQVVDDWIAQQKG
jgi:uncharacterized protein (DUF885 family)